MSYELDQTILQRNSIQDATHVDESTGFKFLMLTHTRHAWLGSSWGICYCDFDNLTPIQKSETKLQTIKVKGFEGLIESRDALSAALNGEIVQITLEPWEEKHWNDFNPLKDEVSTKVFFTGLSDGQKVFFRIKPKTISINGIEVPAPCKPKHFQDVWIISGLQKNGYTMTLNKNGDDYPLGCWLTEDQIKQVVTAHRKVYEVQS